MIYFGKFLLGLSNWYDGLSNRSRLLLVCLGLFLLLGMSTYKLLNAWERLDQPLPKANPQRIIQPMREIFRQVKGPIQTDHQKKLFAKLDSAAKANNSKFFKEP